MQESTSSRACPKAPWAVKTGTFFRFQAARGLSGRGPCRRCVTLLADAAVMFIGTASRSGYASYMSMTSPSMSDTHVLCSAVRGSGHDYVPSNRAFANPRGRVVRRARFEVPSRSFGTSARTQRSRPEQHSKPTVHVALVSRSHVKLRKPQLFFLNIFAFDATRSCEL